MKLLKNSFYLILTLIALFVIIGFFLPKTQHVERQITINAPASAVFAQVNNLRKFNDWSPWAKLDPETKYVFSGPDDGVGAKVSWASDKEDVGKGTQEIIESRPNEFVQTKLDFGMGEPSSAKFILSEKGEQTSIIWAFDAKFDNIISRYFGMMLDKWVGDAYEQGLDNLKTLVEAQK